ncbi:hypothetical protein ATK74_2629 [Propionicimonas paludicola]|uniref:Uncharacterized protein n=1 Tax=Propionicimonas paludicola TaxID=185243 RepID=A0A2A9CWU9_9ACTN|nr:hypothetical protein [Propionicimonas paludicola]PFG18049.1 hypothetical protein ATK74_2629 [Propionicimonas paludicola]
MDQSKTDSQANGKPRREPIELTFSLPQLAGGALAAATAAAIGAQLGVAGTIVGAAVASLVGGIAGTLYSAGLDRTHRKVSTVISQRRAVVVQPEVSPEDQALLLPAEDAGDTLVDLPAVPEAPAGRPRRRIGVWGMVAISTVAIFVLAIAAVSLIELGLGRAFDGGSGTTVGQVVRPPKPSASPSTTVPSDSPTPTPTVTVTHTATMPATPTPPDPSPTPTASPTAPQPTPTPTADPTNTPSG